MIFMKKHEELVFKIIEEAKPLVTPDVRQEIFVKSTLEWLIHELSEIVDDPNIQVTPVGSIVKGTWLPHASDFDIFLVCPPDYYSRFEELLEYVDSILVTRLENHGLPVERVKKHAQHPYLHYVSKNFELDVVPCINIKDYQHELSNINSKTQPSKKIILSAVDRSPLHKQFVLEHLSDSQKIEVRLLKQFLKFLEIYGAEVSTQGISGYLTELLVIKFGSFYKVLQFFSSVRGAVSLRINDSPTEHRSSSRPLQHHASTSSKHRNDAPLVFIDPTDESRNVAAAVNWESYYTFIAACKIFLNYPQLTFFKPLKPRTVADLLSSEHSNDLNFAIIWFHEPTIPPDKIWGQLRKFSKKLETFLLLEDFKGVCVEGFKTVDNKYGVIARVYKHSQFPWRSIKTPYPWLNGFEHFLASIKSNPNIHGPSFKHKDLLTYRKYFVEGFKNAIQAFLSHEASLPPNALRQRLVQVLESQDAVLYNAVPKELEHSSSFLLKLERVVYYRRPWINRVRLETLVS